MPLPRGTFAAMGTVVSVRLGAAGVHADVAVTAVAAVFARWEQRCSLFDPGSELSRVGRGALALADTSDEVRAAYAIALDWRARTGGVFTPHRGDGRIDLNGVVKALAVAEAGEALARAGFARHGLDAGGDVLVAPVAADESSWEIGIVDPAARGAMLARIDLGGHRLAVATSGSVERGDHIWTAPGVGQSPFLQVSVAAADLLTADVLATAIIAGGQEAFDDVADRFDIDALAVRRDGSLLATPGWPRRAEVSARGAEAAR